MSRGLLFWVLMILWGITLIAGFMGVGGVAILGLSQVLAWILFALLGWQVYGAMLK